MTPPKTEKDMLRELHQAVVGIPENPEENGLIGNVKELTRVIKEQNGRIRRNSIKIAAITAMLLAFATLTGLELSNVTHLVGG